jgi:hypothetical protein
MVGDFDDIISALEVAIGGSRTPNAGLSLPLLDCVQEAFQANSKLQGCFDRLLVYLGRASKLSANNMALHSMLKLVNGLTTLKAVDMALNCLANNAKFEQRTLFAISGPKVDKPIQLSPTIRLITPSQALGQLNSFSSRFYNPDYLNWQRATVVAEITATSTLTSETDLSAEYIENMDLNEQKQVQAQINSVLNFLIVNSSSPASISSEYNYIPALDPIFDFTICPSQRKFSTRPPAYLKHPAADYVQEFTAFEVVNPTIQMVINKLASSRKTNNLVEAFFDLGSALEILLNNGDSNKEAIAHRIAMRAAILLSEKLEDRKRVFADVKDVYNFRSAAAHKGTLEGLSKSKLARQEELRKTGEELIVRLIGVFADGFPDWTNVELGSGIAAPSIK